MIKKLTYSEYRTRAKKILDMAQYDWVTFPVDIEKIISNLKIDIVPKKRLLQDHGIKGAAAPSLIGGRPHIYIDEKHWMFQEFYYPFTLAEELAHLYVHSYLYSKVSTTEEAFSLIHSLSESDYKLREQQARNVASYILLPDGVFNRYIINHLNASDSLVLNKKYFSKEDLADTIAKELSPKICLSDRVINLAISARYPEPLIIDQIINEFGLRLLE